MNNNVTPRDLDYMVGGATGGVFGYAERLSDADFREIRLLSV